MRAERRSPAEGAGQAGARAAYPLVRVYRTSPSPYQLPMADVASRSGLPPELVSRFVALGLVEAERDARGGCGSGAARHRPSPGCSDCGPDCTSTTRPSVSSWTCSTASNVWRPHCGAANEPPRSRRHGHEPPHPEIPGSTAGSAERRGADGTGRGRRGAPAAGPARPAGRPDDPSADRQPAPTRPPCEPPSRPISPSARARPVRAPPRAR